MSETRKLVPSDLDQIVEIETLHDRVMGGKKLATYPSLFRIAIVRNYLLEEHGLMWGTFVGDKLQSYVSAYLWRQYPYYTLTNMKTRPGTHNMMSKEPHSISYSLKLMLSEMEKTGRFKFYFIRSTEHWPRHRAAHRFYEGLPEFKRYSRVVELFIPKNTIPKWGYAKSMMSDAAFPVDIALECMTLKQEHRPTSHLLHSIGT